jgi:hypothetical protein
MEELAAQEVRATVPVGEYYATGFAQNGEELSALASASLRATEDLVPVPPVSVPNGPPEPCGELACGPPFGPGMVPAGHVWSTQEALAEQWRFTDASDAQVGQVGFGPLPFATKFWLASQTDGTWQATLMENPSTGGPATEQDILCTAAQTAMAEYSVAGFNPPSPGRVTEGRVGPLGCTFTISDQSGNDVGLFIWRFGVLLAGDPTAHRTIPALPIAPPREIAEAGGP